MELAQGRCPHVPSMGTQILPAKSSELDNEAFLVSRKRGMLGDPQRKWLQYNPSRHYIICTEARSPGVFSSG